MAMWNLARLAETLLSLIDPDDPKHAVAVATAVVEEFQPIYEQRWVAEFCVKLGLPNTDPSDAQLVQELHVGDGA